MVAMVIFGSCAVDSASRTVLRDGREQHLEPQAFDLLAYLVSHRDRVIMKSELLDEVWGDQFVSESSLTTRIKEIRQALGDDGVRQEIVRNFRGRGYRFVAEIEGTEEHDQSATAMLPTNLLRLRPETTERRPGERIVHATVGAGPPMIFMPGWISSLDAFADGTDPRSALVARLAESHAVTLFDRFGTGLSVSDHIDTTIDGSVAEVNALLDKSSSSPTTLFASSAAGPAALLAAADNPQVGRLILMCTYASGPELFTNQQNRAHLIELVEQSWGMGSRILADMIVPGLDAVTRSVFARFQRRTATPEVAAGYIHQLYTADATEALAAIEQPCLILHYRDDPAIPFDGARQLAVGLPNAELVTLEGPYHTPPRAHVDDLAATIRRFVQET
jgi:DNA-binding winged helix-turn-helix (wHTH) protein/pimeloyl-ACP methyl ester carboxylesterase